MTVGEIEEVVRHFVDASRTMAAAGFDGIEIHAAHGYLLSQFLSSASNVRTDAYGGSPAARAKIVLDIIKSVREAVPLASSGKKFAIGIKLNSADHQIEGELDAVIQQLKLITEAGVDFVEISGGSYSDPKVRKLIFIPSHSANWSFSDVLGYGKHQEVRAYRGSRGFLP